MSNSLRAAVLTISDSVYEGKKRDLSGPTVGGLLEKNGWTIVHSRVLSDDLSVITATLRELTGQGIPVIFTTGGTGVAERDVTPEATRKVITREVPGLAEQMRRDGASSEPRAALSRGLAGVAGSSLVVNLPGSPKGAADSLQSILTILPHAVDLIAGKTEHKEDAAGK